MQSSSWHVRTWGMPLLLLIDLACKRVRSSGAAPPRPTPPFTLLCPLAGLVALLQLLLLWLLLASSGALLLPPYRLTIDGLVGLELVR
jgi:hypothetical protein